MVSCLCFDTGPRTFWCLHSAFCCLTSAAILPFVACAQQASFLLVFAYASILLFAVCIQQVSYLLLFTLLGRLLLFAYAGPLPFSVCIQQASFVPLGVCIQPFAICLLLFVHSRPLFCCCLRMQTSCLLLFAYSRPHAFRCLVRQAS